MGAFLSPAAAETKMRAMRRDCEPEFGFAQSGSRR